MGSETPNIGIYIPAAGEDGYDQSFAEGMINVDQHDHSGGPNKGLPIATEGLGDFSVTFDKLNANVVDQSVPGSGIGVSGAFPNQLVILDPLKSIYQLAPAAVGFLTLNGLTASARTFQDSSTITWTNANGTGNPQADVNIAGISPVTVPNGGTGLTSLNPYALIAGGITSTANLQQVSGLGTAQQYLGSNGPAALPSWQNLPSPPAQNFQTATLTLTDSQFRNLSGTPQILVPAQGSGKVIVVNSVWAKLNYGGTLPFGSGSSVRLYWGSGSTEVGFVFTTGSFKDSSTSYYYADDTQSSSATGISPSTIENRNVTVSVNSSNFTNGSGSTVSFSCTYSIMQI